MKALTQCLTAVLMAVPLHLCCWTGMMHAAEDDAACTGCHQFLDPSELPPRHQAPGPDRHCACCDDTLLRQAAPAAVTAPKTAVNDLPSAAWPPQWMLAPPPSAASHAPLFPNAHAPPDPGGVPLYQRHCALLL